MEQAQILIFIHVGGLKFKEEFTFHQEGVEFSNYRRWRQRSILEGKKAVGYIFNYG